MINYKKAGEFFMNKKTEDRRIRKTKQALKNSLAALLEQKDIRDISVQELASHADLNRTTFYLHYKDIYDLQQQIENEAAKKINDILEEYVPLQRHEQIYFLLTKFLTCIQEDVDLHHIILGKNKNQVFLREICRSVELHCVKAWTETFHIQGEEEKLDYFGGFIIQGFMAVIVKWVEFGMKEPPEQMARMMGDMGLYGIRFLEQ